MSPAPNLTPDARAVVRAAEALTTQVRRIADALTTPAGEYAVATDDDALRTARRDSLLVLLSRAGRGVLTRDEAALLRQHVETEMRDAEAARARARKAERAADLLADSHRRAEQADAVTAETKRLLERRTTTLRERAERAEAAIERVRMLVAGRAHPTSAGISDHAIGQHELAAEVLAALDGPNPPRRRDQ